MKKLVVSLFIIISIPVILLVNRKNIHLVGNDPLIIRTAQLSTSEFKELIEEKKISVVLNLRGIRRQWSWYRKEEALMSELGVEFYPLGFPKDTLPSRQKFIKILDVIDDVIANKKNLLIHCKAGADRTGFITAVIKHYVYGENLEQAQESMSWVYGHLPDPQGPLEMVFEDYKLYMDQMNFKEYVTKHYGAKRLLAKSRKPLFRL